MSARGRLCALAFVLTVGGCTGGIGTPPPSLSVSPASTPSLVEPADGPTRTACATAVWQGLVRAFNAGDASALAAAIGSGPISSQAFQWVSFHDALGRNVEYTAEGARQMLLERSSRGQRLTLLSLESGPGPSWHGGVDASLRLESRAPGLTGPAAIAGKTVVSCLGSRVVVASIGDE
jgi:hypothetical protein